MASQVTITAKIGPGLQATSLVLGDVTSISFNLQNRVVSVFQGTKVEVFDLSTVTTVSFSISGQNYTITVS